MDSASRPPVDFSRLSTDRTDLPEPWFTLVTGFSFLCGWILVIGIVLNMAACVVHGPGFPNESSDTPTGRYDEPTAGYSPGSEVPSGYPGDTDHLDEIRREIRQDHDRELEEEIREIEDDLRDEFEHEFEHEYDRGDW